MKKRSSIIISITLIFCLCFCTSGVYAKSLTELQDEIEQKQEELEKGEQKEKDLSKKVNSLEGDIYALNEQIKVSEKQLKQLKKDLKEAQAKVDKQNEDLSLRLRAMYKNGSVGFLDVLMNSNSLKIISSTRDASSIRLSRGTASLSTDTIGTGSSENIRRSRFTFSKEISSMRMRPLPGYAGISLAGGI